MENEFTPGVVEVISEELLANGIEGILIVQLDLIFLSLIWPFSHIYNLITFINNVKYHRHQRKAVIFFVIFSLTNNLQIVNENILLILVYGRF